MYTLKFSHSVLNLYHCYERKTLLLLQQEKSNYHLLLSEVMLEKTQVAAVIHYFKKFISHFHDITYLANGKQDEILNLWNGLCYYARASN